MSTIAALPPARTAVPGTPNHLPHEAGNALALADLFPLRGPVLLATDGHEETSASLAAYHAAAQLRVPLAVVAVLDPVPVYTYGATMPWLRR